MRVEILGKTGYREAYALQESLVAALHDGSGEETLLLLEHPPVYTIGTGGSDTNILRAGIEAVRINRGGDVTYHGPGQLVGYPIIDLGARGRDLHRYLRFLEELLIGVAAALGVSAGRIEGRTGIWTDEGKLASIGVGVRRWISMHGFALNVSTDLGCFDAINPCGIPGCRMASLEKIKKSPICIEEVVNIIVKLFPDLLDRRLPLTGWPHVRRQEHVWKEELKSLHGSRCGPPDRSNTAPPAKSSTVSD
jgi:lipoyl(octanoyl) transferase